MNRSQKIIVSVVGIFIVLLALVGITYGYFLTRIQGNTNTKSISVTTKNLELVYGDGTKNIITKTNIMPDTVIGTKDFTVTNKGADTSYVVLIDGDGDMNNGITPINVTYVTSGTTRNGTAYNAGQSTTFESNDFVYTLTCTSDLGNDCNEQNYETSLPMNGGIILGNNIKEGDVHRYNLTVTYKETNKDQTDDMNKGFNAQVNIEDIKRINPYSDKKTSLAYNIINNSMLNKNGTELVATPPTKVAVETSYAKIISSEKTKVIRFEDIILECPLEEAIGFIEDYNTEVYSYSYSSETACEGEELVTYDDIVGKYICVLETDTTEEILYIKSYNSEEDIAEVMFIENEIEIVHEYEYEKVLSETLDDYGTSYYYRGDVVDNFVNFAGMCWRIVRIDGLGNTKIILEDQNTICNDKIDNDGEGTTDYKFTSDWNIGDANFGYYEKFFTFNFQSITRYYESFLNPKKEANNSMIKKLYDFQETLAKKLNKNIVDSSTQLEINNVLATKLNVGNWCYNDVAYKDKSGTILADFNDETAAYYYDSYVRLHNWDLGPRKIKPTLKCNGTLINEYEKVDDLIEEGTMYVGAITADEYVYAGNSYIDNSSSMNYLNKNGNFMSMSPWYNSSGETFSSSCKVEENCPVRPVVNLLSNINIVGGDGTQDNPYEIEA